MDAADDSRGDDSEDAFEKLDWYAKRWASKYFTRPSRAAVALRNANWPRSQGSRTALRSTSSVAWRILLLTMLGRHDPDQPCTAFFEEHEWKAVIAFTRGPGNVPETAPSLREVTRIVAGLGGFLGRKGGWRTRSQKPLDRASAPRHDFSLLAGIWPRESRASAVSYFSVQRPRIWVKGRAMPGRPSKFNNSRNRQQILPSVSRQSITEGRSVCPIPSVRIIQSGTASIRSDQAGWSEGKEGGATFWKFGLSSSRCESCPAKAEPSRPEASLATWWVITSAMRR